MNIIAIGDPHGNVTRLKRMSLSQADLILVTGDLGCSDHMRKLAFENIRRKKQGLPPKEHSAREHKKAFMEAYNSSLRVMQYLAKFAPVYTIYGNVESTDRETKVLAKELGLPLPSLTQALTRIPNVHVCGYKKFRFQGVTIGALDYFVDTNWVHTFVGKAKTPLLRSARKQTTKAQNLLKRWGRVDILLCHQPPLRILDLVRGKRAPKHWRGKHAGSETILKYIKTEKPAIVFCGHIHEAHGKKIIGSTTVYNLGDGNCQVFDTLP